MKQLTHTLNILYLSIILLSTLCVQGMESESYPLTNISKETLINIFSYCLVNDKDQVKSLENSIKNFIQISMTCKKFNDLLTFETIGNLCKNYAQNDKDQSLLNLMPTINDLTYKRKRLPALILVSAGADANTDKTCYDCLLKRAVIYMDAQTIKILFQHHTDPNVQGYFSDPLFFSIRTIEIAQMFFDNKNFNAHATDKQGMNVLYFLAHPGFDYLPNPGGNSSSELIKFYLERGINAKNYTYDNSCLLHELANHLPCININITEFFKKAELLLNVIPDMINKLNKYGKTPLDAAQKLLEKAQDHKRYITLPEVIEKLIALYKKHGGKTGKEIRQASMILLLHNDDHLGDLSILPRDIRRYIVQYINALSKQIK